MKKTNIRRKNHFIIEENKEYYSSSVVDLEKWKNIEEKYIEDYKEENVTDELTSLMKKFDIYSNVNFFDSKGHKKIVKVDQKGGWFKPFEDKKEQSGGRWGRPSLV